MTESIYIFSFSPFMIALQSSDTEQCLQYWKHPASCPVCSWGPLGVQLTTHPHLLSRLRMHGAINPLLHTPFGMLVKHRDFIIYWALPVSQPIWCWIVGLLVEFGKDTEGNSKSLTFGNMPFVWVSCQHSNVGRPGYEVAVQNTWPQCLAHLKKAVPLQALSGPEGSRKLRFPDFMTTAQDGGKVVSLRHWPPLPPRNTPGTHFW
jgi:hypothetical protein